MNSDKSARPPQGSRGSFLGGKNQALILSFFPLLFNTIAVYDGYSFAANTMGLRRPTPPVPPLPLSCTA